MCPSVVSVAFRSGVGILHKCAKPRGWRGFGWVLVLPTRGVGCTGKDYDSTYTGWSGKSTLVILLEWVY